MKTIDQDTDVITSGSYSSTSYMDNETSGSHFDINFIPSLPNLDLIQPALDVVNRLNDTKIKDQATRLLSAFKEIATAKEKAGADISRLPKLNATILDDGTLFFEWIFPDFRIGFTIGSDPTTNSWFLVTNNKLEEYSSSGNLSTTNLESSLLRMFSFVLTNS